MEKLTNKMPQLRVEDDVRNTMEELACKSDRGLTEFHRLLLRKICKSYRQITIVDGNITLTATFHIHPPE